MNDHQRQIRQGFTLIELLVVIAIIAILAAILLPVFAAARERARSSSCANNEKQISLATTQYVQDYDELYPPAYWGTWNGTWIHWHYLVFPYVKSTQVFVCPSNSNTALADNNVSTKNISMDYEGNTFDTDSCYNGLQKMGDGLFSDGTSGTTIAMVSLGQIVSPATTIQIFETTGSNWTQPGCGYNQPANPVYAGHSRSTNYAFADGHVKSMQPMSTDTTTANLWSRSGAGYDATLAGWLQNSANKYQ